MTLLGLAVVGAIQVFFRYVLHISFAWFEEAGRYLGVFITFLGSAIGVKYGIHFTMDGADRIADAVMEMLMARFRLERAAP